jgi:hypothetical protein
MFHGTRNGQVCQQDSWIPDPLSYSAMDPRFVMLVSNAIANRRACHGWFYCRSPVTTCRRYNLTVRSGAIYFDVSWRTGRRIAGGVEDPISPIDILLEQAICRLTFPTVDDDEETVAIW